LFKYLSNDRGVALLTVMSIMTVFVLVGSLMLYMASSESRVVYEYGNNNRAFYIAEAGSDLAVREWKEYVTGNNNNKNFVADVNTFMNNYNTAVASLKNSFETSYGNVGLVGDYVIVPNPGTGLIPAGSILTLTITGSYDNNKYDQKVQLWYNRSEYDTQWVINSFKGENGAYKAVTGVTLDEHNLTMTTNVGSYKLTATVSPDDATNKAVAWTSADSSVAAVSNTGWVTAGSVAGTAYIIAASDEDSLIKDTCTVKVLASDPGNTPPIIVGPAMLDNIIDTTKITVTGDLYVTGYIEVSNDGILNVSSADVLSVGTNFIAENKSKTTIDDVQNVAIGQNFTILNNADTTISHVQDFTVGSNMNLSNNGQVDFTDVKTIKIGGDFELDNDGKVNFDNVGTLIIEGDFSIANHTHVYFRNTPAVIIKGNLTLTNNSVLEIVQGGTVITLYGTYNTTSNFQVATGAILTIYDESTPPVLLFKMP
jgi:uncharacterized protein YjdB